MTALSLMLNGRAVTAEVEPRTHLADFVRDHMRLTGTHTGCEHGVCGACTVLIDGAPARACIALAVGCDGADVLTIEGLATDLVMERLRLAFSAEHALQCGYCTPGMLVTARDIVMRLPDADDDAVRLELAGNLCRCTGYTGIVRAIRRVLDEQMVPPCPPLAPIAAVTFGAVRLAVVEDRTGTEGLNQRLFFRQPADRIWAALQDPALIASCIPGAHLTHASPGRVEGEMTVAIGPVRARFGGAATLTYDGAAQCGRVEGTGQDGGTRLQASATFRVVPEDEAACVLLVSVEYGVRGALAQLARGRVVDLLAGEIAGAFARNLAARLDGRDIAQPAALPGVGLMARVLWAWLRRMAGRPG